MNRELLYYPGKALKALRQPLMLKQRIEYNFERFKGDRRSRLGLYPYPHQIIFLAGMNMGGSTWMKNLLSQIPGYYTRSTPMPWEVSYYQDICDSAFKHTPVDAYTLFKTHLNPTQDNMDCITRNGVSKILVTYRDFRDAAVALVHRLMEFPKPSNVADFVDYKKMGFDKSLIHVLENIDQYYISWVEGWMGFARKDSNRFHFTKFEELKADTIGSFKKVLEFYELSFSDDLIELIVESAKGKGNMRDNINRSSVLPFGISSNFRSGKVGGWRSEFSEAHVELAKKNIGQSLIDYGYETNLDWSI
jgi:hypothetical protein